MASTGRPEGLVSHAGGLGELLHTTLGLFGGGVPVFVPSLAEVLHVEDHLFVFWQRHRWPGLAIRKQMGNLWHDWLP